MKIRWELGGWVTRTPVEDNEQAPLLMRSHANGLAQQQLDHCRVIDLPEETDEPV